MSRRHRYRLGQRYETFRSQAIEQEVSTTKSNTIAKDVFDGYQLAPLDLSQIDQRASFGDSLGSRPRTKTKRSYTARIPD